MSKCPSCEKKLHVYNISQFCPNCGVNICFHNFEETFIHEAKVAELSQAVMHVKIKNLKAAFIGSKLAIARLVVMLLPIVAFLLPAGTFDMLLPFGNHSYGFGILGLMPMFMGGNDLGYIMSMPSSEFAGAEYSALFNALLVYASVAVLAVFVLLFSILCFISYKNMQKIITVISALGMVDSIVAFFFIKKLATVASKSAVLNVGVGFGCFAILAAFAAVFVVNLLLSIKGIPTDYDEGMVERVEIYKQVKAGKVDIDNDLSQPVVETAATRAIDEEIAKEEEENAAYEREMAERKAAEEAAKEASEDSENE